MRSLRQICPVCTQHHMDPPYVVCIFYHKVSDVVYYATKQVYKKHPLQKIRLTLFRVLGL